MLTNEIVRQYLELDEQIKARAEEVCREHSNKTNYQVADERHPGTAKYLGFRGIVDKSQLEYVCSRWCVYPDYVDIKYLWTETDFEDLVSESNRIAEENNRMLQNEKKI